MWVAPYFFKNTSISEHPLWALGFLTQTCTQPCSWHSWSRSWWNEYASPMVSPWPVERGVSWLHNLKFTVGCRLSPLADWLGAASHGSHPLLAPHPVQKCRDSSEGDPSDACHISFPSGGGTGLELAPPTPLPSLPKANMTLDPGPSALSLATPPVFRDDGTNSLPSTPRLWSWTQASALWILQAQGQGDALGRTSPQPVYRPQPLSPAPICGLPLSQQGQPRVPSSGLPTAHFLPAAQRYRNTHIELGSRARVCVCVCAQVCAHTLEPVPGGEPGGLGVPLEAATPGLISHSSENLPTILTLLKGQTPPAGQEGATSETPSFPQHVFLTHSCLPPAQGPCSPPRSELPTGLPASHDSVHIAWGSLGSGKLGHCPPHHPFN